MNKDDVTRELRTAADDLPAKAASARAALTQMGRKAQDLTLQARSRARGGIDRGRTAAATTLESLAGALRPDGDARARRRIPPIPGGSNLALAAALGIGVALGFMMSRELKRRADPRVETDESLEGPLLPQASPAPDPMTAGLAH